MKQGTGIISKGDTYLLASARVHIIREEKLKYFIPAWEEETEGRLKLSNPEEYVGLLSNL